MEEVLQPLINQYEDRLFLITHKTTYKAVSNTSYSQSITTLNYRDYKIVIKHNLGTNRTVEIISKFPKQKGYTHFLLKTKWSLFKWFNRNSLQITGDTSRFIKKINQLPAIQILNKSIRSTGLKPTIRGYSSDTHYNIVSNYQIAFHRNDEIIISALKFYIDFIELIEMKKHVL